MQAKAIAHFNEARPLDQSLREVDPSAVNGVASVALSDADKGNWRGKERARARFAAHAARAINTGDASTLQSFRDLMKESSSVREHELLGANYAAIAVVNKMMEAEEQRSRRHDTTRAT
jgi:hypothetical protein